MAATDQRPRRVVSILEELCDEALMGDIGLSRANARQRLNEELAYYRNLDLASHSLTDIFSRFCLSLANRAGMFNLVFGGSAQCARFQSAYRAVLFDFDPKKIVANYSGAWQRLLEDLLKARGFTGQQASRQLNEPRALFQSYARGVIAGAEFFAQYAAGAAFAADMRKWLTDADHAVQLPAHLAAQGIPGFGPALAADFLKELGVKELGKPDLWVRRILTAAGLAPPDASEVQVQRVFWKMWDALGDDYPPIIIDKLMFLVGSGRFEMVAPMHLCRSRFPEFQERVAAVATSP